MGTQYNTLPNPNRHTARLVEIAALAGTTVVPIVVPKGPAEFPDEASHAPRNAFEPALDSKGTE